MSRTSLSGWILRAAPLSGTDDLPAVLEPAAAIPTPVPGLIHEGLLAAGRIPEPLIGMNSYECDWIESHRWGYIATFDHPGDDDVDTRHELCFDAIDGRAVVFLNGLRVAIHSNAYRALVIDLTGSLLPGQNELQVWLTQGTEAFSDEDALAPDGVRFATETSLGYREARGELRRIMVRKPAYAFGWDWCPRIATLGLPGPVYLRHTRVARIEHVCCVTTALHHDSANVSIGIELESVHYYRSREMTLACVLRGPDGSDLISRERKVFVRAGLTCIKIDLTVDHPALWWPSGYGAPSLHTVEITLVDGQGRQLDRRHVEFGIRTIALDDVGTFAFVVNGRRVFCQGGNWVPPDMLYTRVTTADYERLIGMAVRAHCNMLRVWGGASYERDTFYKTCDRLGMLVWQDFMFACSPYPDHLDWFRREIELEATYQVRRLASHACLALWCGSNENSWAFDEWWKDQTCRGASLYNEILPRAVHLHASHVAYWTGSPYGGEHPNQVGCGNNHFWKEPGASLCPDLEKRVELVAHDHYHSLFISEYGYLGPCSPASTRRFLGMETLDRKSPVWRHHTNTRRYDETLVAAVKALYGCDYEALSNADHLLLGGLWQGIAYGYSLEAARNRPECGGILMWMWDEAWGEHGWGVVDHYHEPKPAWFFVRRALAPERLVLRRSDDGSVEIALLASCPSGLNYSVEFGRCESDGSVTRLGDFEGAIDGNRIVVARWSASQIGDEPGVLFARGTGSDNRDLTHALLWPGRMFGLPLPEGRLRFEVGSPNKPGAPERVVIEAETFVHAVHLQANGHDLMVSDNYFDMLPGERRSIRLPANVRAEDVVIGWVSPSGGIRGATLSRAGVESLSG